MTTLRLYGVAIVAVAVATVVKLLVPPLGRDLPFLLYFASVLGAALYGGRSSGFVSTAASALVANVLFLPPFFAVSLSAKACLQTFVFVIEGCAITILSDALGRERNRADAQAAAERSSREVAEAARTSLETLLEERRRREEASGFMAEASKLLAGSLALDQTLAAATRLAVPRLADWVAIDVWEGDRIKRMGVAHVDPEKVRIAEELWARLPPRLDDPGGVGRVIRTGEPEEHVLTEEMLDLGVPDPIARDLLRRLGLASSLVLPLRGGERILGAITLVMAESGRRLTGAERAIAEELASRVAVAIENALAYQAVQESSRLKDEFLATVSHELRTPLTAILGWSHLLRTRGAIELPKALDVIERNAKAQARLIEDVIDLTTIASGRLSLELQPQSLASVLAAAVDAARPASDAKDLRVSLDVRGDPRVDADPTRLQQIFANVLSNAIKYTPEGGAIDVEASSDGRHCEVVVRDTGRGIRADFLPYVFERFRRQDPPASRREGGLGLGLSIVRHLVELHGGEVTAESEGEGKGATFRIRLPSASALGGATARS